MTTAGHAIRGPIKLVRESGLVKFTDGWSYLSVMQPNIAVANDLFSYWLYLSAKCKQDQSVSKKIKIGEYLANAKYYQEGGCLVSHWL